MKVLIVLSHLYMGGFSKSLINFLHCIQRYPELKIALLMLENCPTSLESQIPDGVEVVHMDLQYADGWKGKLSLEYQHYKYFFFEMLYGRIKKSPIPTLYVREYAQAKLRDRAHRVINDFSFLMDYDCVISWEECFCNYVMVDHMPAKHKIGYIHPNYLEGGFSAQIDRPYLKKMDRIVTISESCESTLKSVFPEFADKIVCIPNRLNRAYYQRMAAEYEPNLPHDTLNFLTVARALDSHKAVFRMVPLLKRLRTDGLAVRWYFIGDGADMKELKRRIKETNLEDFLICLGEMDNPCPYIAKADLYVQQSYAEGRPVSVDEAIILATPALITDYSSAYEQVENGVTGWVVNNDEGAIYRQLKMLVEHPEMLQRAQEKLSQRSNEAFEDCTPMMNMLREVCGEE